MQAFSNDDHTVLHGDALELLRTHVPDRSVDLIFADPPYNIGKEFNGRKEKWESDQVYLDWCYCWISLCIEKLKDNGTFYIMAATQYMPFIDIFVRKQMAIISRIVWCYDSSGVQAKKRFGSLYEPILHCVKNTEQYTFNIDDILVEAPTGATRRLVDYRKAVPTLYSMMKIPGNVWTIPRVRYRMPEYEDHPTQKPVPLLERIVLASSNLGDTVMDPFAGTFTTCYVAAKHGRRSIGIEMEEKYVKIGIRRTGIATEYKGEHLHRPPKTYEVAYATAGETLTLFEGHHETPVHGKNRKHT